MAENGTTIIAEVGQAHDGSVGVATSYIDAIGELGVDCIKFQFHKADEESTREDMFRTRFSYQDSSRMKYWKRMEFNHEHWKILFDRAKNHNMMFMASAFSPSGVSDLMHLGVPAFKIASGEVTNPEIIDAIIETKLPVFLSTGMSTWAEIDMAVEKFKAAEIDLTVMQCTSMYPTPLENVGLNLIGELKKRYNTKIGLSDHSGTLYPSLAAVALGVDAIEVHVVFDKRLFGPDTTSSITVDELGFLVQFRDALRVISQNPVDKGLLASNLNEVRTLFTRSVAPKRNLQKGMVLDRRDLCLKKPGTGIQPKDVDKIIGKRLNKDISLDQLFRWDDFEKN